MRVCRRTGISGVGGGGILGIVALAAAGLLAALFLRPTPPDVSLERGALPPPVIGLPEQGQAVALVYLVSGANGWGEQDDAAAARLNQQGAITLGIDLPAWLGHLRGQARSCVYTVSDLESVSRQIQRQLGLGHYLSPIVAGAGAGGAMALAIAAQSPAATLSATVSVDPDSFIALDKPLCTPAEKQVVTGGIRYGLRATPLTHAVDIVFTPNARSEQLDHAAALARQHPDVRVVAGSGSSEVALVEHLLERIALPASTEALPVAITPVDGPAPLMAVIVSGDGGWRDIDKKLAAHLAAAGIPSVGLDALRYFWSEQTPAGTARDLEALIDRYGRQFGARRVLLIGYSFGANVLPASYRAIDEAHRRSIDLVALLAPSLLADFRIAVTGWLGLAGEGKYGRVADDIRQMQPSEVLCLYGAAETESACRDLDGSPATVVQLKGGHHFDGDYAALTARILAALPGQASGSSAAP